MDATGRFTDNQSFINELEPEFFTFVFTGNAVDENGASRVYGTASARTLVEHTVTLPDYASTGFLRDMKHIHGGIEAWELKILAVDPSLYRSGIGSMLQDAVEAEVKKRVTLAKSEETKGATQIDGPRGITFMLTTVAEVNEEYYIRKGYRTTQSILLKVGGLRNIKECHIVHMEKVVDL